MNQKGFANIIPILLVVVLAGVVGYLILVKKSADQATPNGQNDSENQIVEKTALLSFTEFFCYLTEQSSPFAYFQFAYQDNGEIKYVRTKTTCDDLIKIGASNKASENSTLFGEKIKLEYSGGKPVKIIRENGSSYQIESSEKIRSFFVSKINVYYHLEYFRNLRPDEVTNECLLIRDNAQHDACLSYQAAFQEDVGICSKMNIASNQDLCRQWVNNIKQGS